MVKEILITIDEVETRLALLEDGVLAEYLVERAKKKSIIGNIYKGRVKTILPGMQAAFVDIGLERNAFLYVQDVAQETSLFSEELDMDSLNNEAFSLANGSPKGADFSIEDLLKADQEILVQIVKEPIGSKGPKVSAHISLPGRVLVLLPTLTHIGISRRIEKEEERIRLRKLLESLGSKDMGFIVRTAAEGKEEEAFLKDIDFLAALWKKIQERSSKEHAPALLHEDLGIIFKALRDFLTPEVDHLIIDSYEEYKRIEDYLGKFLPTLKSRLKLYENETPLFDKYGLTEEIQKILAKKVPLKSGGYLIIEPTEALVVIDVNTGKYVGSKNLEETVLQTNLEAAEEIARQLRLRDLGGIIIIDFIDMVKEENRQQVINRLTEALKPDRSRSHILQITSLGLIEMTRKRVKENLDMLLTHTCPYCGGKGRVKSVPTVAIEVWRALKKLAAFGTGEELLVKVSTEVAHYLLEEYYDQMEILMEQLKAPIQIKAVPDYHRERCEIISVSSQKVVYK